MTNRLLITIGVHAPTGMETLPGVDDAVQRMAAYAKRNPTFDEPIVFSDSKGGETVPLHAGDIQAVLTPDVLKNRPRIVVHFCGHGAQLNGNEVWYLSDGLDQWMDRINVVQFRDLLFSHGARQVCIFSDACQTPASDTADGTPLIRKGNRRRNKVRMDMFRATLKGKPAFAAVDGGPLFSGAVLAVLDQDPLPKSALSKPHLLTKQFVVSSDSLSDYVEDLLPDEAAGVRKTQYAQMRPGLKFGEDDYLIVPPEQAAPDWKGMFAQTESTGILLGMPAGAVGGAPRILSQVTPDSEDGQAIAHETSSEWRQVFWDEARRIADSAFQDGRRLVALVRGDGAAHVPRVCHLPDGSQVDGVDVGPSGNFNGHYLAFDVLADRAVLEVGPMHVPLQLGLTHFLSHLLCVDLPQDGSDRFGVSALGWHEVGFSEPLDTFLDPMQALKGLMTGVLGPAHMGLLAAELRLRKHSDPLYGIVAAYLYDQSGDLDAIRRMCLFYARHGQPVPFDIAMLSRLPLYPAGDSFAIDVPDLEADRAAEAGGMPRYVWEAMRGETALPVTGFAPTLTMGWGRLETIFDSIPAFSALADMRRRGSSQSFPSFTEAEDGAVLRRVMRNPFKTN